MTYIQYQFQELYEAAKEPHGRPIDRLNLLNWFELYDWSSWNGECFDLGDGKHLYPIYKRWAEDDYEIIDAEIR